MFCARSASSLLRMNTSLSFTNSGSLSSGMPIRYRNMPVGSTEAKSRPNSQLPRSANASSNAVVRRCSSACILVTAAGVNSGASSERNFLCSGGSTPCGCITG